MHLVLDGAWTDTRGFWWPFLGTAWSTSELPELGRGGFNVVLELLGAGGVLVGMAPLPPRTSRIAVGLFLQTGRVGPGHRAGERSVLIVVRHGRTEANASGLLLGRRLDPGLDELGRRQAAALAAPWWRGADRVVCSPLRRTRETAAALGLPVEVDERWIELDYGALDGTPLAEVPADVWAAWRADIDFAPGGGESLASVGARVRAACGGPGRGGDRRATSSWSPTCRRSRRRWRGRSAPARRPVADVLRAGVGHRDRHGRAHALAAQLQRDRPPPRSVTGGSGQPLASSLVWEHHCLSPCAERMLTEVRSTQGVV